MLYVNANKLLSISDDEDGSIYIRCEHDDDSAEYNKLMVSYMEQQMVKIKEHVFVVVEHSLVAEVSRTYIEFVGRPVSRHNNPRWDRPDITDLQRHILRRRRSIYTPEINIPTGMGKKVFAKEFLGNFNTQPHKSLHRGLTFDRAWFDEAKHILAKRIFNEVQPTGESKMKNNHMKELLLNNFQTIGVQFQGCHNGVTYTYKAPKDMEFNSKSDENDFVVVVTNDGIKVAEVVRVDAEPDIDLSLGVNYKWIVGKIDFTEYKEMVEKDKKADSLLIELEKRELHNRVKKEFLGELSADEIKLLESELDVNLIEKD